MIVSKDTIILTNNLDRFQAIIRGVNYRKNNLPNSLLFLQRHLSIQKLVTKNKDGRINSSLDEFIIIEKILKLFLDKRIYVPKERRLLLYREHSH